MSVKANYDYGVGTIITLLTVVISMGVGFLLGVYVESTSPDTPTDGRDDCACVPAIHGP